MMSSWNAFEFQRIPAVNPQTRRVFIPMYLCLVKAEGLTSTEDIEYMLEDLYNSISYDDIVVRDVWVPRSSTGLSFIEGGCCL